MNFEVITIISQKGEPSLLIENLTKQGHLKQCHTCEKRKQKYLKTLILAVCERDTVLGSLCHSQELLLI